VVPQVFLDAPSPRLRGEGWGEGRLPVNDSRPQTLICGLHRLPLDRPLVMGVLNVTPDSFSDGGRYLDAAQATEHARQMLAEGSDIIDIGGESTRPGAAPASEREELERVIPLLEKLCPECAARGVPLSVDTRKPAVMRAAIAAGASMINAVGGLSAPGALEAVAGAAAPVAVCLMHMQGEPATMQQHVVYTDVVAEVKAYLGARAAACEGAGIARERIVVDPALASARQWNIISYCCVGSRRSCR
jgi:dihydropteroate synthase